MKREQLLSAIKLTREGFLRKNIVAQTPLVWHKLPTGELKKCMIIKCSVVSVNTLLVIPVWLYTTSYVQFILVVYKSNAASEYL